MRNIVYISLVVSQVVFSIVSYLPQIIKQKKKKKSDDISIPTWILLSLSFIDYAIILQMDKATLSLIFLNVFELSFCIITTILVIYYRKKNKNNQNNKVNNN